jgi:DNA polymerase III, delta subunit|uniref:DNA polymerase III subunit delta n=1 Tax=Bacteroides stercoris TaxID=46506 RepID=UPI00402A4A5B
MAKQEITCDDILRELKAGQYRPIYYLMGEEPYYIDLISDYITDNVLNETEKEFNLTVVYGADVDVATIINAAKRYPMMSEHQVVVVKEAQNIRNIEELSYYLQKPLLSTILVICHKHGVLDKRKKLATEIEKSGILFESRKVKESQLPAFITSYMKRKGIDLEPKATSMLADFVGTDLSRLTGELEKLIITLPKGQTRVTPEQIERNIGISKDYNNFELRSAIVEKDVLKANRIIKYFEENPKTNPIQMTLSLLFGFFSNLMLAYYAPEKSEQGIAAFLGLKSPWQSREYLNAMRMYNGIKTMQIIGEIRYTDAKSKGVGNPSLNDSDLLRELVFKILH